MAYRKAKKPYKGGKPPDPGTPSGVFLPTEETLVKMLALKGATDSEIEEICSLVPGTVAKWRKHYPSFDKALEEGRTKPDAEVLYSLYKNAVGFEYEEEVAVGGKEPTVLNVKRRALPQFPAQKYWMENRQKAQWKNRTTSEVSGPNGGPLGVKVEDRNTLIDSIVALVQAKPDPKPDAR